MFASVAYAMGASGTGAGGVADIGAFVPLIAVLLIFYFMLIRPQQKRAKQHKSMLDSLKKGDQILTSGGLIGRITDMDGDFLTIDLGSTSVTISRSYVVNLVDMRTKTVKED